jgi:Fe-S-cluster-containing dehydrogenase component
MAKVKPARWGKIVDLNKCVGCHACSVACAAENKVQYGMHRTRILDHENGQFPSVYHYTEKWSCNHCQNAPCVLMPVQPKLPTTPSGAPWKLNRSFASGVAIVCWPVLTGQDDE